MLRQITLHHRWQRWTKNSRHSGNWAPALGDQRICRCGCASRWRSLSDCGPLVNAGPSVLSTNSTSRSIIAIGRRVWSSSIIPPDPAKVQINGTRTLLSLLNPERLTVRLDLTGLGPGQASYKINPSMFVVPRGTTVTSVSPSEVILDVDRVVQRDIPVHIEVDGKPAAGYEIAGTEAKPATVMAFGLSCYVNTLAQIATEPLYVEGANAHVERRIDLENPNPAVALTAMRIDAKVNVAEKISDREFKAASVTVRDSDYKFNVAPTRATVTIRGPMLKLQGLDPNSLAYRRCERIDPGSHELPLQVELPGGMQVAYVVALEKGQIGAYRERRSTTVDEHTS